VETIQCAEVIAFFMLPVLMIYERTPITTLVHLGSLLVLPQAVFSEAHLELEA
jgi:hypothetical protein